MKMLLGFVAACLALLALLGWYLLDSRDAITTARAPAVSRPAPEATQPDHLPPSEPLETTPVGESTPPPPPESVIEHVPATRPAATKSPVHWAEDRSRRRVEQRLEAARATLRDDRNHREALRDELAALAELERWPEAAHTLGRLVELEPDDAGLRFELGSVLIRLQRWSAAIDELEQAAAIDPEHARAWFNLAIARRKLGHLTDARAAWDRNIALAPSPGAHERRGEVLLDLSQWAAAAADFEEVLAVNPASDDARLNRALALGRLGRAADARAELVMLLEHCPDHIPARNRLAWLAWEACQVAEAPESRRLRDETIEWCRQSLELDPDQPSIVELLERVQQADKRR